MKILALNTVTSKLSVALDKDGALFPVLRRVGVYVVNSVRMELDADHRRGDLGSREKVARRDGEELFGSAVQGD